MVTYPSRGWKTIFEGEISISPGSISIFFIVKSPISVGFISIFGVTRWGNSLWFFREITQEAGDHLPGDHTAIAAAPTIPGRLGCPSPSLTGGWAHVARVGQLLVFIFRQGWNLLGFLGNLIERQFVWNVGKDLDIADIWFARLVATFVGQISADGVPASPVVLRRTWQNVATDHIFIGTGGAVGIEPDLEGPLPSMMVHALCQFSVFLFGGLEHF